VILVDANLLLYAKFQDFPQHQTAYEWLNAQFNGGARTGLPWPSLLAFVRISTNVRVMQQPLPSRTAWQQVEEWLQLPNIWIPAPGEAHARILGGLIDKTQAVGNLIPDAHLAALALEHGLELYSADTDFARFPGLRWSNPLFKT
jgi:toxin-antitoxin system PIN domain toxin